MSPRIQAYHDFIHETITKTLDILRLSQMARTEAAEQVAVHVKEVAKHHNFAVTPHELNHLCKIAADDLLGLGPLEPLLARADVDEIMVNGPNCVYIEIDGVIERSSVTFRNERQLLSICQRIVAKVGRHVDEASPMCDARLPDGSRVNIILPPLALDGTILTIRKFPAEKITLERMVELGSVDEITAEMIRIIAACRVNVLVTGGTGSGKTTMLNCLTRFINRRERIVTCEDAAELQLQQPHVLRLETRMANTEGGGLVPMRELVKNSLRMRPDRIIVGEVRGAEAFDLLSAMSTGHDGSMGTIHANTPRDALGRLENMIAMAGLNLPIVSVRQQICSAINVIIHVQRIRDGSRKVVSISEVTGMEEDVISMQDLITYQHMGKDAHDKSVGVFRPSKLRPKFFDKLAEYDMEEKFISLMEKAP
jgi:pilus assembly protein CpaF